MKECHVCKTLKNPEEFPKDLSRADGLDYKCKECRRKNNNKSYINRKEAHCLYVREYYTQNKNIKLQYDKEYTKKRRKADPTFRLSKVIKQHVYRVLQEIKHESSEKLVGYNALELKNHLENLFEPWMNWGNYGIEWEIDHKYSIAQYLKDGVMDTKIINGLANLRPLSILENKLKGKKCV
jgi:hypothetical protein